MANRKRKKEFDLHDTWHSRVFVVAEFESEIQISKYSNLPSTMEIAIWKPLFLFFKRFINILNVI